MPSPTRRVRSWSTVPRALHPLAWWAWAICLAVAVNRTTNPLLLLLVLGVVGFVVTRRRTDAPWARAFGYYLGLASVVLVLRVLFRIVFGGGDVPGGTVWFVLPHVPLPHVLAGVRIGGTVTVESVVGAATEGLQLATLLCCVGAANALANPRRVLRLLPGALYELGVAIVVAITVAPQLVESVQRVRRARRLRAGGQKGLRALRAIAIPVLADALDRSLSLAAAMDSRGYGRTGTATPGSRRLTGTLLITGLLGLCAGAYGLLDPTAPRWLGLPAIGVGALLAVGGLALGGRRVSRSRYRPDRWGAPEWTVLAVGVATVVLVYVGGVVDPAGLVPSYPPLALPSLPLLATVGVLLAVLPGVVTPAPERVEPPRPQAVPDRELVSA